MWARKGRTVQVILSIGVGVFAVGLTLGLRDVVEERMTVTWQSATPAHIHIGVGPGVDDDTIRAIANLPTIEGAEGLMATRLRWKRRAEDPWEPSVVRARADYNRQKYDRMELIEGTWPVSGGITVDRGTARILDIPIGTDIYFEVDERARPMRVVGVTFDVWTEPPNFTSDAAFYVTRRDMEKLGGPADFNRIRAVIPEFEEELAKKGALDITDRLDSLDIGYGTPETFEPDRHFFRTSPTASSCCSS